MIAIEKANDVFVRRLGQLEHTLAHGKRNDVIVPYMQTRLCDVIGRLSVTPERPDDDVIDDDLILIWGSQRRIITGSDLLGRLLRGIATVERKAAAIKVDNSYERVDAISREALPPRVLLAVLLSPNPLRSRTIGTIGRPNEPVPQDRM